MQEAKEKKEKQNNKEVLNDKEIFVANLQEFLEELLKLYEGQLNI